MSSTLETDAPRRARYVMIGGFLGAGKSTAVGRLARRYHDGGRRVGLITNDQGRGLVDTEKLRHQGFSVEEIAGGCFCCRFDSLKNAARKLTEAERPDVFVAEPVGSCTDLVATVSYPLRRLYGDQFDVAPLSVMMDPVRASRILGLQEGRKFSPKVSYVYLKQLEEAHVLVINKVDLIDEASRDALRRELARRWPEKTIFEVSAQSGEGLDAWFAHVDSHSIPSKSTLEMDYQTYAEGEALLGWLNATLRLESPRELDGNAWTEALAQAFQTELQDSEVAHLKMTLAPERRPGDMSMGDLAIVHFVGEHVVPELAEHLNAPVAGAQLVINLRAEAAPAELRRALDAVLAGRPELTLDHIECFEPSPPQPTHRIDAEGEACAW